ncbi:MAG: hypothetical protein U0457_04350 [Candidatus Sericytochromatia bacterium]
MHDLPRPKRSLRDRNDDVHRPSYEELVTNPETIKKPINQQESAKNYLSQIDQTTEEIEEPKQTTYTSKIKESIQKTAQKQKVQVLNIRDNRKVTDSIKNESKKEIKENIDKVKGEFQKIESSVKETKEELSKLGTKINQEVNVAKDKVVEFGLQTIESLLTAPKNIVQSMVFKKKPVKSNPQVNNNVPKAPVQANSTKRNIPKINYSDLIKQRVEFSAYDKQKLVDPSLPQNIIESVFMTNAIADVKFCSKYVKELPHATTGMYALKPISFIFDNVKPEDINYFLYYVSLNIKAFSSQNYKFSEAFATWIIRKSHEI